MKNTMISIIVACVVAGSVGFYGGMKYQQSKKIMFPRDAVGNGNFQRLGTNGMRSGGNMGNGGVRPVSGEITAMDDKTITVKLADGSTKIVIYGDSTKISKSSDGVKSDLKVGEKITAIGSQGNDGTVSADSITLGNFFSAKSN